MVEDRTAWVSPHEVGKVPCPAKDCEVFGIVWSDFGKPEVRELRGMMIEHLQQNHPDVPLPWATNRIILIPWEES